LLRRALRRLARGEPLTLLVDVERLPVRVETRAAELGLVGDRLGAVVDLAVLRDAPGELGYRLELYAGANVVARRSVTVDYGSERALEALDVGTAMCRPDGWKLWPAA
jgi:hypothetical protein